MRYRLGPDGIHLFNRETGLNILFDDAQVPDRLWSDSPRQVSIAVTNACDLACPYCYAPKHRARLSPDQLCDWMAELDDAGALGVGFGGGEPTLYRNLPQVCAFAAEHTGLAVTMTTHGHRLEGELVVQLRGAVNFVRVSLDGVGSTYERLRGRSFTTLRERLDLIADNFGLGLNCVVNSDTVGELGEVADIAAAHGATELLLLPEQPTGRLPGASRDVLATMERWVSTYSGALPLAISENATGALPTAIALPKETGLRSYAHIDANGIARASSYSPDGIAVGDQGVLAAFRQLTALEPT